MTDRPALDDVPFMNALLDLLLPARGERPGGGSLGIAEAVTGGLRSDRMLGPAVGAGLEALRAAALNESAEGLPGIPAGAGAALLKAQVAPMMMLGLLRYVYPAYYAHPKVLAGIGREPRPPFPEGFGVEATDPVLLAKLEARRRTPERRPD